MVSEKRGLQAWFVRLARRALGLRALEHARARVRLEVAQEPRLELLGLGDRRGRLRLEHLPEIATTAPISACVHRHVRRECGLLDARGPSKAPSSLPASQTTELPPPGSQGAAHRDLAGVAPSACAQLRLLCREHRLRGLAGVGARDRDDRPSCESFSHQAQRTPNSLGQQEKTQGQSQLDEVFDYKACQR